MHKLFAFLLFAFPIILSAQDTRIYLADPKLTPREHTVDFTHLKLEVSFVPEEGLVKGTVTHTFTTLQQNLDRLQLDGPRIKVLKAKLDGKEIKFGSGNDEQGPVFYFNKELGWETDHKLEIEYEARPRKGLYFIGWNDPQNISRKQIWTQGQGIDNRQWIPMYDEMNDKVITEMVVSFPEKYKVLSNGELLEEKKGKEGHKIWHYKISHPHAPYLIMLGIGEYEIKKEKSKSGIPLYSYYYPDQKHKVDPTYRHNVDLFNWMEEEIGVPYPWKTYSQIPVQDFMFGAMENTTATLFGDFYFTDERGEIDKPYLRVNAHELAHQWFGDMVTARSSAHHWLQESFATHYNMTYQGVVYGKDHFDMVRKKAIVDALKASEKDLKPIAHSQAGVVRHYPKGAFILQMLKYVVGEAEFKKAVKYYLEKHPYGNVDSDDLLIAFHETLGVSLDWFWEQWIYKGGEPEYTVSFQEVQKEGKPFGQFSVQQVHERNDLVGLFKMPIWFEINYTDGTKSMEKVWIENEFHQVNVALDQNKTVQYVLFDPNNEVMKSGTFEKPFEMLEAQAVKAESMLDRYDAVYSMRNIPDSEKERLFKTIFERKDEHYFVKEEIVIQWVKNPSNQNLLSAGFDDGPPQLKQALLRHIGTLPEGWRYQAEAMLKSDSYWSVELALEKLCERFPEFAHKYLKSTYDIEGFRGRNVRIKWHELAFNSTRDSSNLVALINYTSIAYDFQTRVNAANALKRLNHFEPILFNNLVLAILSNNSRLGGPCGKVLDHFYGLNQYKAYIRKTLNDQQFEPWQKKKVKRWM